MKKFLIALLGLIAAGYTFFTTDSFSFLEEEKLPVTESDEPVNETNNSITNNSIEEYTGEIFTVVNNNIPYFTEEDLNRDIFESYTDLDSLERAGTAFAKIDQSLMPTEDRTSIGSVQPTGWHTIKYDIVSGKYLYNRSHLIGFQLTGENANKENLITGTRYFNVEGMLPFENMVADYVKETNDPVLYRVTPIYEGDNLLASGVTIEAKSMRSDGIEFNVYVHNIQPGININYTDGTSNLE